MATIFEDTFDTYNDGDLNAQGTWANTGGTIGIIDVQSTIAKQGKAVGATSSTADENQKKSGTMCNDGQVTVYMYDNSSTSYHSTFTLYEGTSYRILISLNSTGDAKVDYFNGSTYANIGSFTYGQWFYIQVQWQSSDHTWRANVNGGAWTDWISPSGGNWSAGLDSIRLGIDGDAGGGATTYWDYIAENPIPATIYVPRHGFANFNNPAIA